MDDAQDLIKRFKRICFRVQDELFRIVEKFEKLGADIQRLKDSHRAVNFRINTKSGVIEGFERLNEGLQYWGTLVERLLRYELQHLVSY